MPELTTVIIVAADSGASLRDCVQRARASRVPVEIIVVDNASRDGVPQDVAHVHANDARVHVAYNDANLGFGPAVNIAARQAPGDTLLVLNPDCMLESDTVSRLLDVLRVYPDAGVIGAVVCDDNGDPDPASRRRDPLLRRSLNEMTGRAKRDAGAAHEGVDVPGPIPERVVEVENISGALMLIPRGVFDRLGGFDQGYFLHCEDLDLCRRARDAGFKVLLAGNVRVLHAKGGSSAHRPVFVSYHKHRGMWRWFRKFDPAARRPLLRALVAIGIAAHFTATAPLVAARRRNGHT
ncbi:MAG: glycosyltransferase family 2 protein [Rhodanobacteraceae bacterium]